MNETAELLSDLSRQCATLLLQREFRLVVAESCTGGWLAKVLTDLPGSSQWFDRGYVSYSNRAKQGMLGVTEQTLAQHGAVSLETVREMTRGALRQSGADVAVAISGVAGPGGGSDEKPVGTVCFAWQIEGEAPSISQVWFEGDRDQVREQAVVHALEKLVGRLTNG